MASSFVQVGVISVIPWTMSIVPRSVRMTMIRRPHSSNGSTRSGEPTLPMRSPVVATFWGTLIFSSRMAGEGVNSLAIWLVPKKVRVS